MDFTKGLKDLSDKIRNEKDFIESEEDTKFHFILPLFKTLGYHIEDPKNIKHQYAAGTGKKEEKVDIAILKDGEPIIIIECKKYGETLADHTTQLSRYFNALTAVPIAVLTDGGIYQFYCDLDDDNVMDNQPFFEFSMLDIQQPQIDVLRRFAMSDFNSSSIYDYARQLKDITDVKQQIIEDWKKPSDGFARYFLSAVRPDRKKTQSVVDEFKGILKQAFDQFMAEQNSSPPPKPKPATPDKPKSTTPNKPKSEDRKKVVLTFMGSHEFESYVACWIRFLELLSDFSGTRFEEVVGKKWGLQKHSYFSRDPNDLKQAFVDANPTQIKETGIYVNRHLNRPKIQKNMELLSSHFGCEERPTLS